MTKRKTAQAEFPLVTLIQVQVIRALLRLIMHRYRPYIHLDGFYIILLPSRGATISSIPRLIQPLEETPISQPQSISYAGRIHTERRRPIHFESWPRPRSRLQRSRRVFARCS